MKKVSLRRPKSRAMNYLRRLVALILFSVSGLADQRVTDPTDDWPIYGGDSGHRQFSSLRQVTVDNVSTLEQAWVYRSAPEYELPRGSELQVNPLVVEGVLYGISPQYRVFALAADTGTRLWEFDPASGIEALKDLGGQSLLGLMASHKRGLTFQRHSKGDRIFFAVGHLLYCLSAESGEPILDFGRNGVVDLREGFGRPVDTLGVSGNTPGVIYDDLLIMGTRVGEHERGRARRYPRL